MEMNVIININKRKREEEDEEAICVEEKRRKSFGDRLDKDAREHVNLLTRRFANIQIFCKGNNYEFFLLKDSTNCEAFQMCIRCHLLSDNQNFKRLTPNSTFCKNIEVSFFDSIDEVYVRQISNLTFSKVDIPRIIFSPQTRVQEIKKKNYYIIEGSGESVKFGFEMFQQLEEQIQYFFNHLVPCVRSEVSKNHDSFPNPEKIVGHRACVPSLF